MIQLGLIRHGHTEWNRFGRIQGRTDIPLDETAISELSQLVLPADWVTADLLSSPLQRAMQTGRLISDRTPKIEPALMEMNWGDWEGGRGLDLKADPNSGFKDIEYWGWNFTPPSGESPADIRDRLMPWVAGLSQKTVAVCHIGIMRVLLALATGWNFAGKAPFAIKRNRLFIIEISDGEMKFLPDQIRLENR